MKIVDGWYVPSHDIDCHPAILRQSQDIPEVLKYVKEAHVCVQAGGNFGVWPKILSQHFETVYTFEPDPENFNCLCRNVPDHNVVKIQGGLGNSNSMIAVGVTAAHELHNCGAYQITGQGAIPSFMIDDLCLPYCDLIYLDIEGFEKFALEGAQYTIKEFHPVIVFEDKVLPLNYGIKLGDVEKYLEQFGYKVVQRIHRDVIMSVT